MKYVVQGQTRNKTVTKQKKSTLQPGLYGDNLDTKLKASSEESFTWQVLTIKPKQRTHRKHNYYNIQQNQTSLTRK